MNHTLLGWLALFGALNAAAYLFFGAWMTWQMWRHDNRSRFVRAARIAARADDGNPLRAIKPDRIDFDAELQNLNEEMDT